MLGPNFKLLWLGLAHCTGWCLKARLIHGAERPVCVPFVQTFKFCLFIACFMLHFYL